MGLPIAITVGRVPGFRGRISPQLVPGKRFQAPIRVRAAKAQCNAPPIGLVGRGRKHISSAFTPVPGDLRLSLRRLKLPTSPLVSDSGGYVGQAGSFVGQAGVLLLAPARNQFSMPKCLLRTKAGKRAR